jgi:hypothetical protein
MNGEGALSSHAGVHAGPVIERDLDVFGHTVNLASRIADAAAPGEVLVSDVVAEAVGDASFGFERIDDVDLKGVPGPVTLYRGHSMSIEQLDAAMAAPVGGVVLTVPANPAIGTGTWAFEIGRDYLGPACLLLLASLNPAQAERMPGRIRVHLEVIGRVCVLSSRLQHLRTQRHDMIVGFREVVDPQVEVDLLLGCALRPVGRDVVGRQLNPDPWFTVHHHHVPVILGIDGAIEHSCPEGALGGEV